MESLGYIASILMGLSLGMIGGGGSILTVPILVYLFKIDPVLSTGYSLFIVGTTALVGGLIALRKKEVDLTTGFIFAAPSFLGVFLIRRFVVPALPATVFHTEFFTLTKPALVMLVFAILMVLASVSMIRKTKTQSQKVLNTKIKYLLIGLEGLIVGGVTGFVGAGGGFLIIPALVLLVGLPMKMAVGTSLLIIAVKSLLGFTGDLMTQSSIDWGFLMILSAIAVLGIYIGGRLKGLVAESQLKKGFGYFVLVMGMVILLDQGQKLF